MNFGYSSIRLHGIIQQRRMRKWKVPLITFHIQANERTYHVCTSGVMPNSILYFPLSFRHTLTRLDGKMKAHKIDVFNVLSLARFCPKFDIFHV